MDLYLLFRTIKGLKYKLGAHVNNLKMPRDHFKLLMWLWEDIGFQQFKKDCFEKLEGQNARLIHEWKTPLELSYYVFMSSLRPQPPRELCHRPRQKRSPSFLSPLFLVSIPLGHVQGAVLGVPSQSLLVYSINADESFSQTDWNHMSELSPMKGQRITFIKQSLKRKLTATRNWLFSL